MPDTQTIAGLKREARKQAKERGHELGKWSRGDILHMADCQRCGSTVFIDVDPGSGSRSDISGATSRDCPGNTLANDVQGLFRSQVYTLTTWGAGNSSAAYVRVFHAYEGEIVEDTWTIARLLDESTHNARGLRRGGSGYNRALDVLLAAARRAGTTLDQGRWREL